MEDAIELDEDELLGFCEPESKLAFSEEEERRLLEEDDGEDCYNLLDYDEDLTVNYNEINISENYDEFYEEADEGERKDSKDRLSEQKSAEESSNDFEKSAQAPAPETSSFLKDENTYQNHLPIKSMGSNSSQKTTLPHTNRNNNDFIDRRNHFLRQPRPQRWISNSNRRSAPLPLPRGPFPLIQRPIYLPRPALIASHNRIPHHAQHNSRMQLYPPLQNHYDVRHSWGPATSYPIPAPPIASYSPAYATAPATLSSLSSFTNRPVNNVTTYTTPVRTQKPTIYVNPHFQGSVNLRPNMPRLAWHEQNAGSTFCSSSNNSIPRSPHYNSYSNMSGVSSQRPNPRPEMNLQQLPSSKSNIVQRTDQTLNLLDTASRRRKLEESMKASSSSIVSPPKRLHKDSDDDVTCLEDNDIPPTKEELKRAAELGVDIAYLREYERKQKEIKEKSALIAKEKEEKRKRKILESKSSKVTPTHQQKTVQKVHPTISRPTTFPTPTAAQPPTVVSASVKSVKPKPHLTPEERFKKFSSEQNLIEQQRAASIQPAPSSSLSSQSTHRTVVNSSSAESGNQIVPARTVVIDRSRSVNVTNSIPSHDRPNRIVKIKSTTEVQADNKQGNIRRAICVGNLLPETAESDLKKMLNLFGTGKIRKFTQDKTKALVLFENETDAQNFKTEVDRVDVRGIKLRAYFYQESE